jgi:pyruvate, water dikinase
MRKIIQLIISLTCAFMLCINCAEARRMNTDNQPADGQGLMKPPPSQLPSQQEQVAPPAGIMCQDCNIPIKPVPQSQRVWQPQVNALSVWQQLSKPSRDFEFSKFVLDIKTNKIYFVDSNVFTLHADFVVDYLQKIPRTPENMRRYNQNYSTKKPQFILGYLTHYPQIKAGTQSQNNGLWTFSFWEGDTITPKDIRSTYKKLQQTFKVAPLVYRPDSTRQENVAKLLKPYKIATINNNQIYKSQPYQAFNTGVAVGRLNIVPVGSKFENLQFAADEIVILQEAYPDISPVAGIVTSVPSTPLAHVNLRAAAWGIPNATDIYAAELYFVQQHKWVRMEVSEQQLMITPASAQEIAAAQVKLTVKQIDLPKADLAAIQLAPLNAIRATDATKYGAKTANLGEMVYANNLLMMTNSMGLPTSELAPRTNQVAGSTLINIPDGFGIPFNYYVAHIKQHKIDSQIAAMLSHPNFKNDVAWRKQALQALRQAIIKAPLSPSALTSITKQWQTQLAKKGVFVRSSTNAEDLTGFNGAGLYDTVPNVKTDAALEAAIKQVWASSWNLRAVEERSHFGIDHSQVYPAVLIQTAVNAAAAGVLLTTDIWGHQAGTYTINAKWGLGLRVVEGQKVAEQILYDTNNDGTRVISRSDETTMLVASANGGMIEMPVPKNEAILTEKRAKLLGMAAKRVTKIFKDTDVLDIEWVLEIKDGQDLIWLVQARPYVIKK